MEEKEELEHQEGYEPRPAWQVSGARTGLALFILLVICQIMSIAGARL